MLGFGKRVHTISSSTQNFSVAQVGFKLGNPSVSVTQVLGITGVSNHTQYSFIFASIDGE